MKMNCIEHVMHINRSQQIGFYHDTFRIPSNNIQDIRIL